MRDAARAAARREGLSVGEWLTRHILRDAPGLEEDAPTLRASGETPDNWEAPSAAVLQRDSQETPAPPGESQSHEAWRRIEEQLRGIGRRLDTNERSHGESNRFLSRTAQDMNASARGQAQAVEQLSLTVGDLRERLERLERSAPGGNIREAIKALHLGLSRLADQLTANAGKSAGQMEQLTANLEKLAAHLGKVWENADNNARLLNQRIDLAQIELTKRLEDGERSLNARLSAAEKTTLFNTNALDHALEKIETAASQRAAELAESQRRAVQHEENLRDLKESLAQLEARLPGMKLEARLNTIERSIGGLKETVTERRSVPAFGTAVQDVSQRLDRLEKDHAELMGDPWTKPALEPLDIFAPYPSEPLAETPPEQALSVPEAPEQETPIQETPIQETASQETAEQEPAVSASFASEPEISVPQEQEPGRESEEMAPFAPRDYGFHPLQETEEESDIAFQAIFAESQRDDLLAEAQRSAQAALERAEDERIARLSSYHTGSDAADGEEKPRSRYLVPVAAILVVAIVATAALLMSQRAKRLGEQLAASSPVTDKIPVLPSLPANPQIAAAPPARDSGPQNDQTSEIPSASRDTAQETPATDPGKPAAQTPAPKTVASAGTDRVVQLADAGNPMALTILGLRALDGTGSTPVNLPDAVKFLNRAADKGQAVAQYRLGTLYERGQGVAADTIKAMHWYELSADQGNRKAMHNLAVAYASGPAAQRNMTLAAHWFAKAAALGLADSQFNLAVLYERGEGVSQSLTDAYKWYAIAALSGDAEAKARLGVLDTQLSESDRTAAGKAAAGFHAAPLMRSVNVPPEPADLGT
ncbi:MAG TPA: hypothetical protein VNX61_02650 [Rhizomicrobium sp.]|nr:hypothetical protein [Rhizomicrobium sp.]